MEQKTLVISHLNTSFFTEKGEVPAVRDVSLQVRPGQIVGIVGESGCGKSVTARSVMGLIRYPGKVTGGSVLLNGRDITLLPEKERRKLRGSEISMIFQEPMTSLNPVVKAGKQVEEALLGNSLSELIFPMEYTAIVCFRDEVAYPVMSALREHGVRIPEDVSVISFDNLHAEDSSRPAVTSIYSADQNIAALGVEMLLERIEDPAIAPRNVVLPVRIFEHGTTGPAGAAETADGE